MSSRAFFNPLTMRRARARSTDRHAETNGKIRMQFNVKKVALNAMQVPESEKKRFFLSSRNMQTRALRALPR